MSLGYALLHPRQLDAALLMEPQKRGFDTAFDMICGALGIANVDAELAAAFAAQGSAIEGFMARLDTLAQPGRPLAQFRGLVQIDISDPGQIAQAIDGLCTLVETAGPEQIRALAIPVIDALLEALPNLQTAAVAGFVTQRLDEVIGILKAPLRKGHKDVAAIKAYRAAMSLRCLLNPVFRNLDAAGQVDLKLTLRAVLIGLLDRMDGADFTPLRALCARMKGEFGGLFDAILSCAGGTVAAGVQTMPADPFTLADEVRAVPHRHDRGTGLWVADLLTNCLSLFNLIWEVHRTRPFVERGFDGALMILGIVWHAARTLLRAAIPDAISRPPQGEDADAGQIFLNWLFSDWGDAAVNLFLRLLISIVYEAPDAKTNWALMFTPRILGWFANTFNTRIWYQFARSLWYFELYKNRAGLADNPELGKIPLGRMLMGILPPIWLLMGIIGGGFMPWDEFEAAAWDWHYAIMAGIPLVLWFVAHLWVSSAAGLEGYGSITKATLPDLTFLITAVAGIVLMAIALIIVVTGLESEAQALAMTFVILIPALLLVFLALMGIFWATGDTSSGAQVWFSQIFSLLTTTVMGLFAAVTWWFIIDDGRDKEGDYDGLDVARTPYLLPLRAGENWFCGQSFHGVFSHLYSSPGNHHAIDMNEAPGRSGLATRAGFVTNVAQGNPDDEPMQNDVGLMHATWAENADPGSDQERVLTYSTFVHTQERGVHARVGQYVPRGQHLTDIDSTGISAVHHTHYSADTAQRGAGSETLPVLFGDDSLRAFRAYWPLSVLPGKGHVPGKPISFAFYISDNAEAEPHPHAVTLETAEAAVDHAGTPVAHRHRILIDRTHFADGTIPDTLVLRTTVAAGHFHTVSLTRTQLLQIFRMDAPTSAATTTDAGHSHAVMGPMLYDFVRITLENASIKVAGRTREHRHFAFLGWDYLDRNVVPPGGLTLTMTGAFDHHHELTLSPDQVATALRLGAPAARTGPILGAPPTISAHTHATVRANGVTTSMLQMAPRIVEPPAGQLVARQPGPYALLGERMVLRLNDRTTEWHFWGGARARNPADIAIDRGLQEGQPLQIGTDTFVPPGTSGARLSAAGTAAALSLALRGGTATVPITAPPRRAVVRAEPVVVIETRQRGSGARLDLTGGTLPHALLPAGSAASARGTGPFADLAAVPKAAFLSHVEGILQTGWPAPPGTLAATLNAQRLQLQIGGGAAAFAGSSSRVGQVATGLYDTAARTFRATGPIPLGGGRLALAPGYDLPLLATPARLSVAAPAAGTSLSLTVDGAPPVTVTAAETAAETARRISTGVEGLRAHADGSDLVIETVGSGPGAGLSLTVGGVAATTVPGARPAGFGYDDLTRLAPADLQAIVTDAAARAGLPAALAGANLRLLRSSPADPANEARLDLGIDAPFILSAAIVPTGAQAPLAFPAAQPNPQTLRSTPLPTTLRFDGPAWIDLTVTGAETHLIRIPVDGEPARLDLVADRLPSAGETLALSVNGTALTVTFDGTEQTVARMAERIGAASDGLVVRIAHRLVVEDMLWGAEGGDLGLRENAGANDGLTLAGFLGPRPVAPGPRVGRGEDMASQRASLPPPVVTEGVLLDHVTLSQIPTGGGTRMRLTSALPQTALVINAVPGPDPLGLAAAATPGAVESAPLAATTDLGGPVRHYTLWLYDAAGHGLAVGLAQIAAQPAVARSTEPASLPIAGPAVLEIGITPPGGTRRTARASLAGLTSLDAVAARLNAASPELRAWVARISEVPNADSTHGVVRSFDDRLHVETAGGGTGWQLDLSDTQTAAALGFPLSAEAGGRLVFAGRGNVQDGAAATRAEIAEALQEAAASLTGSVNRTTARTRISVRTDGATIELRSAEGPVEVEFDPPELARRLAHEVEPQRTRLNPPPAAGAAPGQLPLDSGRIRLRAAGRGLAAVELFAAPAELRSPQPIQVALDDVVAEQLALLRAHPLRLQIGGSLRVLPLVPASATTLEDAVEFLARASNPGAGWSGQDWWIGLRDTGRAKACVIQTRQRGSGAQIALDLTAFPDPLPVNGILGFTDRRTEARGAGNVADMDAVPMTGTGSLLALVEEAVRRGGARQAAYVAETATGDVLRLRGALSATRLRQTTTSAPGGLDLRPATAGALTAATIQTVFPGRHPLPPGLVQIDAGPPADTRAARALVHAEPARLGPLALPASLAVLDGRLLGLSIDGAARDIALAADATTTPLALARQIERKAGWTLRALLAPDQSALMLETRHRGSAARLALRPPAGPDAVTGNAATGFTAPDPTTGAVAGTGSVPDIDAVGAADYAAVLQDAILAERRDADRSLHDTLSVAGSTYDPPQRDLTDPNLPVRPLLREHARIASQRTGCASSVVPVTLNGAPALPAAFAMDRSLERAPAVRAALRLPPAPARRLSGRLHIDFNENAGIADLPPLQTVTLDIPDADYTPAALAALIHGHLFDAGIGAAQAYPDGSVMVETLEPGLAGTIRIPAATTPAGDAPLAQLLLPGGGFARGWPGAGRDSPNTARAAGFRSRDGALAAAAAWQFTDGAAPSPAASGTTPTRTDASITHAAPAGTTLAATATALDTALSAPRDPSGAVQSRLGIAAIGADGALYVEGLVPGFDLIGGVEQVDASTARFLPALPVDPPPRKGGTPERQEDPAAGLRRTHEARTLRILRDRDGHDRLDAHDDLGWVRLPADPRTGAALPIRSMPPGRYLTLGRVDAARTTDYGDATEMIVHAAVHPDDPTRPVILQARYWLDWDRSALMGVEFGPGGVVLLRLERGMR